MRTQEIKNNLGNKCLSKISELRHKQCLKGEALIQSFTEWFIGQFGTDLTTIRRMVDSKKRMGMDTHTFTVLSAVDGEPIFCIHMSENGLVQKIV
jgi:hypothetical protein